MRRRTPLAPIALLAIFVLALAGPSIAATIPVYLPYLSAPPAPTATPTAMATPTPSPTPYAGPDVRVAEWCSKWNADGNDNQNLNDEYVCLQNHDAVTADMADWRVQDAVGATYTFPEFSLSPATHVRIHTGSGANTATDLYWGRGSAVWNNTGDTVFLYDDAGSLVDEYNY